jgi:CheY-like chemotaxis protein
MRMPVVLVVDDDADFRTVLVEVLRDEGCKSLEAANGEDALHMLELLTPDAIIVDLMMPVMNGWSLFAAIQERPHLRGVRVAFLSAIARMVPAGAALVLKKPLNLPSLLKLLDTVRLGSDNSETCH